MPSDYSKEARPVKRALVTRKLREARQFQLELQTHFETACFLPGEEALCLKEAINLGVIQSFVKDYLPTLYLFENDHKKIEGLNYTLNDMICKGVLDNKKTHTIYQNVQDYRFLHRVNPDFGFFDTENTMDTLMESGFLEHLGEVASHLFFFFMITTARRKESFEVYRKGSEELLRDYFWYHRNRANEGNGVLTVESIPYRDSSDMVLHTITYKSGEYTWNTD